MKLRVGTRGSALATAQTAASVQGLIEAGVEVETILVETQGDLVQDRPFQEVGAAGVFVREIENALLEDRIDLAVHSYKDLPSVSPEGLVVAAIPERLDAADLWITRREHPVAFAERTASTRVGTASARRRALLREGCPDLEPRLLRGNVPTRLDKLRAGEHDAILLAAAGLERLRRHAARAGEPFALLEGLSVERLDPRSFVPAPTQGALAWQLRAADRERVELARAHEQPGVRPTVDCERALLAAIQGGCDLPFGAWCEPDGEELVLHAVLAEGNELRRAVIRGRDPADVARRAHAALRPGAAS